MEYTKKQIRKIYLTPLLELITKARIIHKQNFEDKIELCKLISVKTGGCPEDCAYCSQSNSNHTEIKFNALLPITEVERLVIKAKANGVKRICMGAGYKSPTDSAIARVAEYIDLIKKHGLEACATLGSLTIQTITSILNHYKMT
jgi:biotin synthase